MHRIWLAVNVVGWVAGCRAAPPAPRAWSEPVDTAAESTEVRQSDAPGNVLIVLIDDFGVDRVSAYGVHPEPPPTPTLDALAAEGVLFRNAWASPLCSPTRANVLTGRYGRRTGIGANVDLYGTERLPLEEVTIAELAAASAHGYRAAAIGKWHLAGLFGSGFMENPLLQGFHTHRGAPANLDLPSAPSSWPIDYFHWEKAVDGVIEVTTTYATTDAVDEALAFVREQDAPWLVLLAFNAPHEPVHVPPAHLQLQPVDASTPDWGLYNASVVAADLELGRLLDALAPEVRERTTVIVLGDNGTPGHLVREPWPDPTMAKGTLFEGGVRVPLIVSGPLVQHPGSESQALVHAIDVFPTVANLVDVDVSTLTWPDGRAVALDGTSLVPQLADPDAPGRALLFTERFGPNGGPPYDTLDRVAVRDARWKYAVHRESGLEGLWDLDVGLPEGPNLLEESALSEEAAEALGRLRTAVATFDAEVVYDGFVP